MNGVCYVLHNTRTDEVLIYDNMYLSYRVPFLHLDDSIAPINASKIVQATTWDGRLESYDVKICQGGWDKNAAEEMKTNVATKFEEMNCAIIDLVWMSVDQILFVGCSGERTEEELQHASFNKLSSVCQTIIPRALFPNNVQLPLSANSYLIIVDVETTQILMEHRPDRKHKDKECYSLPYQTHMPLGIPIGVKTIICNENQRISMCVGKNIDRAAVKRVFKDERYVWRDLFEATSLALSRDGVIDDLDWVIAYSSMSPLHTAQSHFREQGLIAEEIAVYAKLTALSEAFNKRIKFPVQINRMHNMVAAGRCTEQDVVKMASGVMPLIHARTRDLIHHGLCAGKTCKVVDLIERFITKRPLCFYNPGDSFLLRDGTNGRGSGFMRDIEKYMNYDEVLYAALVSIAVPTLFINSGGRYNMGLPQNAHKFVQHVCLYVAMVGPRFEKRFHNEYRHMIVDPEQNDDLSKGYGAKSDFARSMYGIDGFPTYQEAVKGAKEGDRFIPLTNYYPVEGCFFDSKVYKNHMQLLFTPFLAHSTKYAATLGCDRVHFRISGLGLGYWAIDKEIQIPLYIEALKQSVLQMTLMKNTIIEMQYVTKGSTNALWADANNNVVVVQCTEDDPASPLPKTDDKVLIAACYAWDSNAYPGNEYYEGALDASGDPAAACCSMIQELQNPEVNPKMARRYAVYDQSGISCKTL